MSKRRKPESAEFIRAYRPLYLQRGFVGREQRPNARCAPEKIDPMRLSSGAILWRVRRGRQPACFEDCVVRAEETKPAAAESKGAAKAMGSWLERTRGQAGQIRTVPKIQLWPEATIWREAGNEAFVCRSRAPRRRW